MPVPIAGSDPKVKGKVDVALVIDVTSSMRGCLENLKKNLVAILREINNAATGKYNLPSPDIAFNVVGFRDLVEDQADQLLLMGTEFTADLDRVEAFLERPEMQAAGGGEEMESALDALYAAATRLNWTRPARVIVLLTDAPTRSCLHPGSTAGTALDDENSMAVVADGIVSGKFRVILFGPKGVKEFRQISGWDRCRFVELDLSGDTLKAFKDSGLFEKFVMPLIVATASAGFKTI